MIFRSIFKKFSTEEEETKKKSVAKTNSFWFILISASSFLIYSLFHKKRLLGTATA
ncbi:hypothetical protein DDB_G0292078 [Dictyostelium discoideum AX4]|uniref:Uncharacterized transmembrane protein DDB_G0292078 n=1 Tax=Dictyostelium discoideum TaxID=44689 RepID=Y4208_DICDI|nr:hypothetical protein DDB_G0292078 [Dictyostelium discoideum AX4]Q54DQ8.1 RecName: Full=Uncharacterized transmembrane protein DDB_G0292078 [Dictyostelium discoideum]EAL61395.1 hypothetical protein DDB_G0292078 [Dictyostelium discoideum AX4]|eukprot:XP_629814.1 hypothetical protein DDB_G0292078 [Dictyostelium discoideum AX4]